MIEPSAGADRGTLAFLCEAYHEDQAPDDKGDMQTRIVMKFHPRIAPVKAAVFPLVKKDGMPEAAKEIYTALKQRFVVFYDEKGAVGRRYRRQDEAGTPYCITVDGQTLQDNTVTIRDRDSLEQWRVKTADVVEEIAKRVEGVSPRACTAYRATAQPRRQLVELPFEIREQHVRARAAHEIGIKRRRAARAHRREDFGRLLQLAEPRVNFLQLAGRESAVPPEPRRNQHQAENECALAAEREAERQVPIQHLLRGQRPGDKPNPARRARWPQRSR